MWRPYVRALLFKVLVLFLFQETNTARILLSPFLVSSHVAQFMQVGKALIEHNHDVYVMFSDTSPDVKKYSGGNIPILQYHAARADHFSTDMSKLAAQFDHFRNRLPMDEFRTNRQDILAFCENPLADEKFYERLKSLKFDLSIVDIFPGNRCLLILMYRLGIPYVGMTIVHEPWLSRSPALPSFAPISIGSGFTEQMTFWQRLVNTYQLIDWTVAPRVNLLDDKLVTKYAPEKPAVTLDYLAGKCLLFLIENDIILDYPRPLMPNEIFIGGLTLKPAKRLPKDLEKFVSSAPEGVIVVSFGSMPFALPASAVPKFVTAFRQLKQRVIWRTPSSATPDNVPPNVRLLDWLPQNDLLGSPKTKLFITHAGAHGQFEALYHGVPMIAMPSFAEQQYNANRMYYHKFGIKMDIHDFEAHELSENIRIIIGDQTYKDNIVKASQIYRSRPMNSTERAVYWTEHVLKYGGDHLRSHSLHMPWYQVLMVDILAVLLLVFVLTIGIIYCTCQCLCNKLLSSQSTRKHKRS